MTLGELKARIDKFCTRKGLSNTDVVLYNNCLYLAEFEDPEDTEDGFGRWVLLDYVAEPEKVDQAD